MDKRREWHEANMKREKKTAWQEEKLELTGALYTILALALSFCGYQYFCVYRKQERPNPQYVHVMPDVPSFA